MIVTNIKARGLEIARQVVNTAKGVARHLTTPSTQVPIVSPPNIVKVETVAVHPLQAQIAALGQQLAAAETRIKELEAQVGIDAFTGFLTKEQGLSVLGVEIERSIRYQHPVSIIIFDLDHFKKVNDTYGHLAGDQVLKTLAELIRTHTRANFDRLIRFGGEEFIAVLPETDEKGAMAVAEKINWLVERHLFNITDNNGTKLQIKKTISGGIAQFDAKIDVEQKDENTGEIITKTAQLIKRADTYLYNSKEKGRNRISGQADLAAA